MKISLFIILFSSLAFADQMGDNILNAENKVMQVLYDHSQCKKDIDEGFKKLQQNTPDYILNPLKFILPIIGAVHDKKVTLGYKYEF